MLSYEFVPFGSVLQEKIENDCDTVLEKDSGKHRSIMIEPVDCHLYKILHPERTALHCLGWKELNVFFFRTKFRLSTQLPIFSIDA